MAWPTRAPTLCPPKSKQYRCGRGNFVSRGSNALQIGHGSIVLLKQEYKARYRACSGVARAKEVPSSSESGDETIIERVTG